ncbi:MAG TPA: ankyrin repeat domain-containing protein, partial [Candidatus Nitrosotenuis sp.]|nr:ankyrin repeat domain-containing protein [Candidatus Nitrosotenuis sp.]
MLFHERVQLSHGETPLHDAARSNTVDAIKFLVENGVKVDVTDHYGRTPLHVAAETNANAVAQLLLKKGAFLETRDHNGSSPLQVAVQNNSIDVINVLLQNGADLTVKNPYGYGLLHLAAALGYQRVVELLIDKAIILLQEKYFKDKYGCTPLHMAKRRGFHNIAKLFIPYLSPIENQVIQFNKVTTAENLYTLILNGQFSSYIEWARKSHKDEMVAKALTLTPLLSKSSTVKLPTGEYLGWTQGIAELHQLGLTGKNVLIGLIDFDLDDELGHGPTVENIIQAIAPGVRIVRREVVRDSPPSPNSISINTHTIHFKWSSRLKSMIDQVIICYPYDQNHPAWNDKKIPQKIVVKAGEEIFLYHGNIKNLIKINNTFCYIDIFKNDFTKWELLEKVPITSDNKAGKVIFELMRQGVTIINYSKGIDGLLWTQ